MKSMAYPQKLGDGTFVFVSTRHFEMKDGFEKTVPFQKPGCVGHNYSLFRVDSCDPVGESEFGKPLYKSTMVQL